MSASEKQLKTHSVELPGRDWIEARETSSGLTEIKYIGCSELKNLIVFNQKKYGDFQHWPLPMGNTHSELLIRELQLKFKGQWQFPYDALELCHCRAVQTITVDQAVVAGSHSTEKVSRKTGASTACGTCKPDVEKILNYRLNRTK